MNGNTNLADKKIEESQGDIADILSILATRSVIKSYAITNRASETIDSYCEVLFIYRFFNGANTYGIWAKDFSGTAGKILGSNNIDSTVTVSFSNGQWSVQNKMDGAITVVELRQHP